MLRQGYTTLCKLFRPSRTSWHLMFLSIVVGHSPNAARITVAVGSSILPRSCISRLAAFSGNGDLIWRQSPWGARLWWKFDLETWNRNEKQQHPGSPPLYACHGFRGEFFDMVFVYTKKWSIWMWDLPMSLFDLYVHIAVVYSVHARTHLYTYSLLPNNPKMKKIWDI